MTPPPCCNYATVCIDVHFGNIWNCSKHIKTKFSKQKSQWERNDLMVLEQECCYSLLFLNMCHYSSPYGSGHACLAYTLKLLSCSKRWFQLMPRPVHFFITHYILQALSLQFTTECSISVNYFIHSVMCFAVRAAPLPDAVSLGPTLFTLHLHLQLRFWCIWNFCVRHLLNIQNWHFFLTYMLCILRWFLTSGALIMQLTFNEERISHCAVAFFILGHAGVPSWHSGLFYHQGAHTLRESSNDGMITKYSRHNYKSTWD